MEWNIHCGGQFRRLISWYNDQAKADQKHLYDPGLSVAAFAATGTEVLLNIDGETLQVRHPAPRAAVLRFLKDQTQD